MLVKLRLNIADINNSFYQDFNLTLTLFEEETGVDVMKKLFCISLFAHEDVDIDKEGPFSQRPFLIRKSLTDEIVFAVEYRLVEDKLLKSFFNHSNSRKFVFFNQEEQESYIKKHKDIFFKYPHDSIRIEIEETALMDMDENYFKRAKDTTVTIDGSEIYVNFEDLSLSGKIIE